MGVTVRSCAGRLLEIRNYSKRKLHVIFQLAIEPKIAQQVTEIVSCIIDASYEKTNLVKVVKKHCCHLSRDRYEEI